MKKIGQGEGILKIRDLGHKVIITLASYFENVSYPWMGLTHCGKALKVHYDELKHR
jgi:hypothetical protein